MTRLVQVLKADVDAADTHRVPPSRSGACMAGESAAEVARRLREKAKRQQAAAELWERGAAGERATASALSQLPLPEWAVLHDLAWPGRQRANLDHVVVGPGGVFVIDAKNWSGKVEVTDSVLRQNGRQRESAVSGAGEAAVAVTRLIGATASVPVVPVLCFHQEDPISGWARDAMICSTGNVVAMLRSRPPVLTEQQVRDVTRVLASSLQPAGAKTPARTTRSGSATTGPAPRPTLSRQTRRRRTSRLAPAIVAALVGLAIATPGVFPAITGALSDFVVSTATDDDQVADPIKKTKNDQGTDQKKREGGDAKRRP